MRSFFERIVGNGDTKARIGQAILDGVLPHALLITGDDGSGKTTLATEIAAAVNCEARGRAGALPCGSCNTCKRIREGIFLDCRILRRREDKASVGITEIRDFLADFTLSGAESDERFYIIDDAHLMTVQAQNSLLKVLEEPPEGVYIILLAQQADKLLSTIKSRVQAVAMSRFSDADTDSYLMKNCDDARLLKRADPEGYASAVSSAGGCIGRAIELMNKRAIEDAKAQDDAARAIVRALSPKVQYTDVREAVYALPTKRPELVAALERITDGICEILSFRYSKQKPRRVFRNADEAAELLREIGPARLIAAYELILETHDYCTKNANVSAMLSRLAAELAGE